MNWLLFLLAQTDPTVPLPTIPAVPTIPITPPTWETGPILAGVILTVVGTLVTAMTQIINAILSSKNRSQDRDDAHRREETQKIVKSVVDDTHKIVDTQRTKTDETIKNMQAMIDSLQKTITTHQAKNPPKDTVP